jgi:hypothetical protein
MLTLEGLWAVGFHANKNNWIELKLLLFYLLLITQTFSCLAISQRPEFKKVGFLPLVRRISGSHETWKKAVLRNFVSFIGTYKQNPE